MTGECDETVDDASFPYGCHVCEVEIDPELGTCIPALTTSDER